MTEDRLYFRQLLSGRDFARDDQIARQMVNYAYLVGDRQTNECVVIDPAYGIDDLVDLAEADGMRITGALVTHYHPHHCGGSFAGHEIEGAAELVGRCGCPVHVQTDELPWIQRTTSLSETDLVGHSGGDTIMVGEVPIQLLHTHGHTPGSQCFLVDGRLVAGDTLFLEGCGWDSRAKALCESRPKQLFVPAPCMWLRPRPSEQLGAGRCYACPLYRTAERRGVLATTGHSTNFVMLVRMPTEVDPSHWVLRGVALLSQLSE